jgi:hypothetical protein
MFGSVIDLNIWGPKDRLENLGCVKLKMSRREKYQVDLNQYFREFLKSNDEEKLKEYLLLNSNLPGPRGNLELAEVFADLVGEYGGEDSSLWGLCERFTMLSLAEAPVNNPKEFLVFCGTEGIGELGSSPEFFQKAMSRLKELASDTRWRTREGVAMAIQRLIRKRREDTLKHLDGWIEKDNWLVMRAVAAGVGEPALLVDEQTPKCALELHKKIFSRVLAAKERKSEKFKTLKQGLGYTLSVVAQAVPKEAFEYMRLLASSSDADVLWILKENLKKKRLTKNFPEEVASLSDFFRDENDK